MSIYDLNAYDYDLPAELIANVPAKRRDESRLLVVDRVGQVQAQVNFSDIVNWMDRNWVLVLNNTKVFKARLTAIKKGKGLLIEMLVIKELKPGYWEVMCKRAKKVKVGDVYIVKAGSDNLEMRVVDRLAEGMRVVKVDVSRGKFLWLLERAGVVPLPPYIQQQPQVDYQSLYQTVFAKSIGSVAAPTAGLHFTSDLLAKIRKALD